MQVGDCASQTSAAPTSPPALQPSHPAWEMHARISCTLESKSHLFCHRPQPPPVHIRYTYCTDRKEHQIFIWQKDIEFWTMCLMMKAASIKRRPAGSKKKRAIPQTMSQAGRWRTLPLSLSWEMLVCDSSSTTVSATGRRYHGDLILARIPQVTNHILFMASMRCCRHPPQCYFTTVRPAHK